VLALAACVIAAAAPPTARAQQATDDELVNDSPGDGDDDESAGFGEPEEPEGPTQPAHLVGSVSGGLTARIVNNLDFQQGRFGPSFIDLFGAFVFPGSGTWRHGAGLAISTNLTGDGSYTNGVDPFLQWAFTPSYVAFFRFSEDFAALAHLGIPLVMAYNSVVGEMERSIGGEVGIGGTFFLLAGLGIFAEVTADIFVGAESSIHPTASFELGVLIDYEMLP